ncbi:MAG: Spo0B domain-containing protein [Alicyclobacillus sp.]|nr:Spo0B domain-containing protein [Alicyclobacillus sp.]
MHRSGGGQALQGAGFAAGEEHSLQAFRIHRHDVLNGLQLIRGYIQLDRPAQAIASIDRLTAWLHSLGVWHAQVEQCGAHLLWTAARCPYVHLTEVIRPPAWTDALRAGTAEVWSWLNDVASRHGSAGLAIRLSGEPRADVAVPAAAGRERVRLELVQGEEVRGWWHTVTDFPAAVEDGRVRLDVRSGG